MPRPATLTPKKQAIIAHKVANPSLSVRDIAKQADCGVTTVQEVLTKYGLNLNTIENFKENKTKIYLGIQEKILSSITEQDITKSSLQQKITSSGIIDDKLKDLSGESRVVPMVTINMIGVEQRPVEVIDVGCSNNYHEIENR
jgi:hypothetical protein